MDAGGQPPEHISQKTYKQVRTKYESVWSFVHTMKAAFSAAFLLQRRVFSCPLFLFAGEMQEQFSIISLKRRRTR